MGIRDWVFGAFHQSWKEDEIKMLRNFHEIEKESGDWLRAKYIEATNRHDLEVAALRKQLEACRARLFHLIERDFVEKQSHRPDNNK